MGMGGRRPRPGHHGPQFAGRSKPIEKTFGPTIADAIWKELGLRGLATADAAGADLHAHYYLLIAVGFNTQQFGQFLPAVPDGASRRLPGGNQAYEIISTGSVVLDLISTSAKRIVWRGIAQAELDSEKTDEQRHARIREGVHELMLKYPKQKWRSAFQVSAEIA